VVIALMTAVFWAADAERHPVRATIVLCTIVNAGMIVYVARYTYSWKRREWDRRNREAE
jgi:hypothetical protein